MRFVVLLLVLGAVAGGCSTLPLPGMTSGVPQSCEERLSESSCQQGTHCRWINDSMRGDGTYATAHCSKE
jgi:hypothetical protein